MKKELTEEYGMPELKRITQDQLEDLIAQIIYTIQGRKTTTCVFILKNQFEIVGSSACMNPDDFDQELGRKAAYDDAFRKLWDYEAYHRQAEHADAVFLARDRARILGNLAERAKAEL